MPAKIFAFFVVLAIAPDAVADPTFITKDNYKSSADSPFDLAEGGYYLEDFENAKVDSPGLSIPGLGDGKLGAPMLAGPADAAASIDPDGWSLRGVHYWTRLDGVDYAEIYGEFDAAVLGGLPTDLGFVFTAANVAPDFIQLSVSGAGSNFGGQSSPSFAVNRFVGAHLDGGIQYFVLRLFHEMPSDPGFEIDHIQYGAIVPEPATAALLATGGIGLLVLGMRRRSS